MRQIASWKCGNGHVMGQVVRNGSGVRKLMLYRVAVDDLAEMAEVDVVAVIEGYVADIRCSVCGGMRTWVPGEEAIRALLGRWFEREDLNREGAKTQRREEEGQREFGGLTRGGNGVK